MGKPLKILYIITQGEWGGAERYVYDLATGLGPDFEVIVAVGEPKSPRREIQEKLAKNTNIRIVQLAHLIRKVSPIRDILAIFELAKLYKSLQPDIIHLNSTKAGILGSLAATSYKLPARLRYGEAVAGGQATISVVYTVHGWIFNEPTLWLRKKLYFYAEKFTARLKNGFITLSAFETEQGKNLLKIPDSKINIIPHGILTPLAPLSRIDARNKLLEKTGLKISEKNIWLGVIANYYHTKGLDILISALALKKSLLPNFCCLLIGDGPERNKLSDLIKKNKLEQNIFLAGTVDEAVQFLPAFDLFVLPSRKEGLPYALLEALSAGLPIVATTVGGVPTIVTDKKTGLLVPPEDAVALVDAIEFALKNKSAFRPSAVRFSLSEEIGKTISFYRSLTRR